MPQTLLVISNSFRGWGSSYTAIAFGISLNDVTSFVSNLNPLVDACSVLFVIMPYKVASKNIFKVFKEKLTISL